MSLTKTANELLVVALQDLHDAELAWTERGLAFLGKVGAELALFLKADLARSAEQSDGLSALLSSMDAPLAGDPNIWLRAILDDAARDSRSITPGTLLDTALIGAFRKGKQAERVSYETAAELASQLELREVQAKLARFIDQEASADRVLRAMLEKTVGGLSAQ